jgi:ribonuclease H2 subunit B
MSRIIIAPQQADPEDRRLLLLPHPASSEECYFLYSNDRLLQIQLVDQPHASFILGNNIIPEGSFYTCTAYDPLFLVLPLLQAHSHQLVTLETLLSVDEFPHLMELERFTELPKLLPSICDSKGDLTTATNEAEEIFYRVNADKCLEWLKRKVEHMLNNFTVLGFDMVSGVESRTLIVLDVLSDNLSAKQHKILVDSYGYNVNETEFHKRLSTTREMLFTRSGHRRKNPRKSPRR